MYAPELNSLSHRNGPIGGLSFLVLSFMVKWQNVCTWTFTWPLWANKSLETLLKSNVGAWIYINKKNIWCLQGHIHKLFDIIGLNLNLISSSIPMGTLVAYAIFYGYFGSIWRDRVFCLFIHSILLYIIKIAWSIKKIEEKDTYRPLTYLDHILIIEILIYILKKENS